MKILPALLVLVALPAVARQPQITGFKGDGTLTWTNSIPDGYYSVESVLDMGFTWCPFTTGTWNQVSVSSVTTCRLDLSVYDDVHIPIPGLSNLLSSAFFRVVASSNEISMPIVTSTVCMVNNSSHTISNITVGSKVAGSRIAATNIVALPPGGTTEWVNVSCPYVFYITVACGTYYSDGWYVTYDQGETNRFLEVPMIALGPPLKEIVGVVSNDSITATWTWLDWTNTKTW